MTPRIALFLFALTILTGCAAGSIGASLPTPANIAITPPAADIAPELAAFSGTWEGIWDGALPSRLIVERIDATSARVVYVWGASPSGAFQAGWGRYSANVLPGGKLQWGGGGIRYIFTMSQDRASIAGEREAGGSVSIVTMKKVTTANP